MRSGLVPLLDRLCCAAGEAGGGVEQQQLAVLAWAGFKVLAKRCMQWQEEEQNEEREECISLPHQVQPDNFSPLYNYHTTVRALSRSLCC